MKRHRMDVLQWFPGCLNMLFIMKAYEIHFLLRKANHKMPIMEPKLLRHSFVRIETNKFVEWDSLCIMQIQYHAIF